jgi:hypothetical protein
MAIFSPKSVTRFQLHLYCENCLKPHFHTLVVPQLDDAPRDVDELMESAVLQNLSIICRVCDYPIGQIVAITQETKPTALEEA